VHGTVLAAVSAAGHPAQERKTKQAELSGAEVLCLFFAIHFPGREDPEKGKGLPCFQGRQKEKEENRHVGEG
jgi:hypothetical protein